MVIDLESSSSDTEIKNNEHKKYSKVRILYLSLICFATNCLSSIALEAGSRGSFRSISTIRPAIFNNLFRRNYNLRIKILVTNVLMALVSTVMLTIGDIYGIPYLYLPWLVNTIEGMAFYEGPTVFGLAYTMLPNANMPTGLFIFISLFIYVEELCIWKDVLVSFGRCWKNYNKNKKLRGELATMNKELCNKNEESFDPIMKNSQDQQESVNHYKNFDDKNPIIKSVKSEFLIRNRYSKGPFTEING